MASERAVDVEVVGISVELRREEFGVRLVLPLGMDPQEEVVL